MLWLKKLKNFAFLQIILFNNNFTSLNQFEFKNMHWKLFQCIFNAFSICIENYYAFK